MSSGYEAFLDWLDVVQLLVTFLYVAGCVWVFHRCAKARDLSFNSLWIPRLALLCTTSLWALSAVFNNPVIFHPVDGAWTTTAAQQGDVCLAYHFLNYGLAEPATLLTIAFLLGARVSSLTEYEPLPLGLSVLRRVAFWGAPSLAFHLVVVILNKAANNTPSFVFLAYSPAIRLCTIPILTLANAGVVSLGFLLAFNVFAHRLGSSLINRPLRVRLRLLRLVMTACLILGLLSRLIVLFYDIGTSLDFLPSGEAGSMTVGSLKQVYHFATIFSFAVAVRTLVYRPCVEAAERPFRWNAAGLGAQAAHLAADGDAHANHGETSEFHSPPRPRLPPQSATPEGVQLAVLGGSAGEKFE